MRTVSPSSVVMWTGAVVLVAAGCASSGGAGADGGGSSFARAMAAQYASASREIVQLDQLSSQPGGESPVVVLADIVDVKRDRGWVNLPESEIKDGIDTREVPFDAPEPHFRTILVTLDVTSTLRAGDTLETAETRQAVADGGQIELTLVLPGDASFDAAHSELLALGDVVIPLEESARGSWGMVLNPYSGYDIVIDVHQDGTLGMPFAEAGIADYVLGDLGTLDALTAAFKVRTK